MFAGLVTVCLGTSCMCHSAQVWNNVRLIQQCFNSAGMEPKALISFNCTHLLSFTTRMSPIRTTCSHFCSLNFLLRRRCSQRYHSQRKRPNFRNHPLFQSPFRYRSTSNFGLLTGGSERRADVARPTSPPPSSRSRSTMSLRSADPASSLRRGP
jgi:hypothetical protein